MLIGRHAEPDRTARVEAVASGEVNEGYPDQERRGEPLAGTGEEDY